jgi:hypothetical protein
MNARSMMNAFFLLITAILLVANASIGKQCYNDNPAYGKSKKSNNSFMTYMIGAGVCLIIVSFGLMYMSTKM